MPSLTSKPCPHCACTQLHEESGKCLDCWDGQQRMEAVNRHQKCYAGKACRCGEVSRYVANGRCAVCSPDPDRVIVPAKLGPLTPGKMFKPVRLRTYGGDLDLALS
jgi:hypothetical protein